MSTLESRVEELRKKMNEKYGEKDEEKKTSSTTQASTDYNATRVEQLRSEMNSKYNRASEVNDDFINTFFTDAEKYIGNAQSSIAKLGFSNAASTYDTYADTIADLRSRYGAISQYIKTNRSSYAEDAYKSISSRLDSAIEAINGSHNTFYTSKKYYSQWDTEEDYNDYVTKQKEFEAYRRDYEAKKNFDLDAGQKEIAGLESILGEYKNLSRWEQDEKGQARLDAIRQEYGDERDIKALISEKQQYLNQAKHIQDGITLSGVTGNADFKENSGYTSTKNVYNELQTFKCSNNKSTRATCWIYNSQ